MAHTHNREWTKKNVIKEAFKLDQDASLQPEPVSSRNFVKFLFPIWHKYQNESSSKSLDVKIKESHQRGLPLTTQQLQQTQKDEWLSSALIAPDETVCLEAPQIGGHMCVLAKQQQQQQQQHPCSEFVKLHYFPGRNTWLMGPSCGKKKQGV